MNDILFEYKSTPAFGYNGMPGGGSITVYSDGLIALSSFVFGQEAPFVEDAIAFVPKVAVLIKKILLAHKDDLEIISSELRNGTLNGSHDCFQFGDKRISSWTIKRTDLNEVLQKNPGYYKRYKENMIQENMVLDIYNEIISVIDNLELGLEFKKRRTIGDLIEYTASGGTPPGKSKAERLRELKELLTKGILTQDAFDGEMRRLES